MDAASTNVPSRTPGNKGKVIGQKAPLKPKDIWAIRVRLQIQHRSKHLALFNLGFDSKLRDCDLVGLRVRDVCHCPPFQHSTSIRGSPGTWPRLTGDLRDRE